MRAPCSQFSAKEGSQEVLCLLNQPSPRGRPPHTHTHPIAIVCLSWALSPLALVTLPPPHVLSVKTSGKYNPASWTWYLIEILGSKPGMVVLLISALWRQKQVDLCEFKDTLACTVRSRPAKGCIVRVNTCKISRRGHDTSAYASGNKRTIHS